MKTHVVQENIARFRENVEESGDTIYSEELTLHCHACNEEIEVENDLAHEIKTHDGVCDSIVCDIDKFYPVYSLGYDVWIDTNDALREVEVEINVGTEPED